MISQIVCNLYRFFRVNIAIPCEPQRSQSVSAVITTVYRKNQPAMLSENRIRYNLGYFCICRIQFIYLFFCLHNIFCSFGLLQQAFFHILPSFYIRNITRGIICTTPCQTKKQTNKCSSTSNFFQFHHLRFILV